MGPRLSLCLEMRYVKARRLSPSLAKPSRNEPRRKTVTDTNSVIAGLLRDLAAVQTSRQSQWGYNRAAEAVAGLPAQIESFLQADGTLRKIAQVGPSSTRVIMEVIQTGRSATVERAVAESAKAGDVEKSRGWRETFLSRADVLAALGNR